MKISVQSQLLVMLCFLTSLASFYLIGSQYYETKSFESQRDEIALDAVKITHLQSMLSQWMVTLDLFYYNRQSYLVPGIVQQAGQITQQLENLSFNDAELINHVDQVKMFVGQVSSEVNQSAIEGDDRSEQWLSFIKSMDAKTEQVILNYEQLNISVKRELEQKEQGLTKQNRFMVISFVLSLSITIGILCLLGIWNSRKIIKPLMHLVNVAKTRKEKKGDTSNALNAPYELQLIQSELQLSFKRLAKGKKKAESDKNKIACQNKQLQETIKSLEETQHQLVKSEKLASIGRLASGVAHEINNPIGYVVSNLDTLTQYLFKLKGYIQCSQQAGISADSLAETYRDHDIDFILQDVPDLVNSLSDGLGRVSNIVNDLRTFSDSSDEERTPVAIQSILQQALNLCYSSIPSNVEVVSRFDDSPLIPGNGGRLVQAFVSIINNACDAVGESGTITLSVIHDKENNSVIATVEDSGKGIIDTELSKIFDPFYTTKPVGQGVGLSLHMCDSIIESHGGSIKASSVLNEGTTIQVTFPIASHPIKTKS